LGNFFTEAVKFSQENDERATVRLVFVDDGSIDSSQEIVREFMRELKGSVDIVLLALSKNDVTPFVGPGLMRVGGCGHAATPC